MAGVNMPEGLKVHRCLTSAEMLEVALAERIGEEEENEKGKK